jgi:hypothetical protein
MVAAALTIIGPTVDRILYFLFHVQVLPLAIPLETFAFLLIDFILIVLLIKDVKEKANARPLWVTLSVYTGS